MLRRNLAKLAFQQRVARRHWRRSRILDRMYRLPSEQLETEVKQRLTVLLRRAAKQVPFYRTLFEANGWEASRAEEYWADWPVLTQQQLQEHRDELIADDADRSKLTLDSSGGSSGFIKTFYHSPQFQEWHTPEVYWADSLAGWMPGARRARLWGAGKDLKSAQKLKNRMKFWLRNERLYDSFSMSDAIMQDYHQSLHRFSPDILVAYAGSIYDFARYLKKHEITPSYPRTSIISSAEPLTKQMRDAITEVFRCPVYDRYGSREVGIIACECDAHEGLHVCSLHNFVEVVRPNTLETIQEELGDLLVTTLSEPNAPLIRYQIGDGGIASAKQCDCGLHTPKLLEIRGKIHDFIRTPDGRKIYGEYFTHVIYGMPNIRRFMVIQKSLTLVILKLAVVKPLSEEDRRTILSGFEDALTRAVTVRIEEVDDIPPLPSGKYRFTLSEVTDE